MKLRIRPQRDHTDILLRSFSGSCPVSIVVTDDGMFEISGEDRMLEQAAEGLRKTGHHVEKVT